MTDVVAGADQPDLLGSEEHEHQRAIETSGGGEGAGQADTTAVPEALSSAPG